MISFDKPFHNLLIPVLAYAFRQFPAMFSSQADQAKGKKRFVAHPRQTISSIKTTELQIYVLSEPAAPNTPKLTPSSSEELILAHAGLGKRLITFNEIAKHDEVR